MATREEVLRIVVRPMTEFYNQPHGDFGEVRLKFVLETYVTALQPFTAKALAKAWEQVVAKHDKWDWPTPAKIKRESYLAS